MRARAATINTARRRGAFTGMSAAIAEVANAENANAMMLRIASALPSRPTGTVT
jgi:hypothetical protein